MSTEDSTLCIQLSHDELNGLSFVDNEIHAEKGLDGETGDNVTFNTPGNGIDGTPDEDITSSIQCNSSVSLRNKMQQIISQILDRW